MSFALPQLVASGLVPGMPYIRTAPAIFAPADYGDDLLGDVKFWDPSVYTLVGSAMSAIIDPVIGGTFTQSIATQRPTVSGAWANFDGSDDELRWAGVYGGAATPYEVWALVRQDALAADTSSRLAWSCGDNIVNTANWRFFGRGVYAGVNRGRMLGGTGAGDAQINGTTVDLSGKHVLRAVYSGAAITLYVDGQKTGPVACVPNTGSVQTRIGTRPTGLGGYWKGGITEIFVTRPLADEKVALIGPYIELKLAA